MTTVKAQQDAQEAQLEEMFLARQAERKPFAAKEKARKTASRNDNRRQNV